KRIYEQVEERRRARPDLDYVATPHLQAHPLLIDAFLRRVEEALHGEGHMNCSLCQYRVPILGVEHKVGEPQAPHHHHVQGLHGEHVHSLEGHGHHHHHDHPHEHEEAGGSHAWSGELVERLQF